MRRTSVTALCLFCLGACSSKSPSSSAEYRVTLEYMFREPAAKMTKCTLAEPVTIKGTTYAAYSELKIELGEIEGTPTR